VKPIILGISRRKKRNARVKTIEEPILMLNHYFKINDHSNLNSSVMVQFGKIGNSNLDYQNANSPDPTYFRNYLVIIVPCMAKTRENIRVLLRRIMKKMRRVAFSF
jgi:hypothetical protein